MDKYRHIGYEDDGVDLYECMACKAQFGLRHGTINFCMTCGKAVTRHECRQSHNPRWIYDRWGNDGIPFEMHELRCRTKKVLPDWIVMRRSRHSWNGKDGPFDEWTKWEQCYRIKDEHAISAYSRMKDYIEWERRDYEDDDMFVCEHEYRMQIA